MCKDLQNSLSALVWSLLNGPYYRWALMMIDLYWTGRMLNPTLRGWAPLYEHDQSRRILNRVFRKLTPDDETYVCVLNQYQDFLKNRGPFQEAVDPILQGAPPHEWWDAISRSTKTQVNPGSALKRPKTPPR